MGEKIIIGVGNPLRGDDGAGWAVIDHLVHKIHPEIQLSKQRGDIVELVEVFANYATVYLVDACSMEAPAGTWQRIDGLCESLPAENAQTSTHGFGIAQAIELARNLNALPSKLIVYAIVGQEYAMSDSLTAPVVEAVKQVADEILKEEGIHA